MRLLDFFHFILHDYSISRLPWKPGSIYSKVSRRRGRSFLEPTGARTVSSLALGAASSGSD